VGVMLPPSAPRDTAWTGSSPSLLEVLREPGLEPRPIRFAVDDEVVGVTREAVDGALGADRIGKGCEPFVWATI
jgi:hypothetical protein